MRGLLKFPLVYNTFQRLVGGTKMRSLCLELLAPKPCEKLLDVGCGPAYYLSQLPALSYFGFDTDEGYIQHARQRFGQRGQFFSEPFTAKHAESLGPFDAVILMGLLHHLGDDDCHRLLDSIASALTPGGRVIALDTVVHPKQNRAEHLLAIKDRGEYVRSPEGFLSLAKAHFSEVKGHLPESSWVPSIYWIMELAHPLGTRGTP